MTPSAVGDLNRARERVERALCMATGFGGLVFGGLLATRIISQWDQLLPVYAFASLAIAIVIPATFTVLAWVLPIRTLKYVVGTVAVGFVILQLLWVPSMTVPYLEDGAAPWIQGVNAAHATMAAVVWRHRLVWLYAAVQGPIVAGVRYLATGTDPRAALLDGLGAVVFCSILLLTGVALISAAQQQDLLAARARAQASLEAAARTREREQARINAIVHDDIMSVLLVASREAAGSRLAEQAESALASIATLSIDPDEAPDYGPSEAVTALRSAVTDVASQVEFWTSVAGSMPIPANVVEALTEATSEAIRNSMLHAGAPEDIIHRVVNVTVADGGVRVLIQDSGRGFNVRAINDRRLGIRVSIYERMRLLEGGDAKVESRQGQGTTVTLMWSRHA